MYHQQAKWASKIIHKCTWLIKKKAKKKKREQKAIGQIEANSKMVE